jgi:hypothetical protein
LSQNPLREFMSIYYRTEPEKTMYVKACTIFLHYKDFKSGKSEMGQITFNRHLDNLGFEKIVIRNIVHYNVSRIPNTTYREFMRNSVDEI